MNSAIGNTLLSYKKSARLYDGKKLHHTLLLNPALAYVQFQASLIIRV